MTLVNAGHPAGFLVRDAAPVALESTGPPLALLPEPQYEALSVDLLPGDLGVFVTDGSRRPWRVEISSSWLPIRRAG
jgi:serine phosphatase RsbU (regulator of sigma subunit)